MKTLLLDVDTWDLVADAAGNIAVADDPYSKAQDVACAIRTFLAECWYDTTDGVPYFATILGEAPPTTYFREQMVAAALTVPGVVDAVCVLESFEDRDVKGYVRFTDDDGVTQTVAF